MISFQEKVKSLRERYEQLIIKANEPEEFGNGIYTRYKNPILTAEHTPLEWRYDFNEKENTILIGYTFYGTNSWGKNVNPQLKKLMLDYIFQFVETVIFHVGKENIRSQKAMERLGAEQVREEEIAYFGELPKTNVVFEIKKENWLNYLPEHS